MQVLNLNLNKQINRLESLRQNTKQSKQTMSYPCVCDTISFTGGQNKNSMLTYYKNVMQNYEPKTVEEKELSKAIINFLNVNSKSSQFEQTLQKFLSIYDRIEDSILENIEKSSEKLKYVFSALIEGLDNSKTAEHSKQFINILFDSFLETFLDNPSLQEVLRYYSESNLLKRTIIKDLLKKY